MTDDTARPLPRTPAFSWEVALVGVPLAMTAYLTMCALWTAVRAARLPEERTLDEIMGGPADTSVFLDWYAWYAAGAIAAGALAALVLFVLTRRTFRPERGTLLPWGILGTVAGAVTGPLVASQVLYVFRHFAYY